MVSVVSEIQSSFWDSFEDWLSESVSDSLSYAFWALSSDEPGSELVKLDFYL